MSGVSRRTFLQLTGAGAVGGALAPWSTAQAQAESPATVGQATLPYPEVAVGKAGALEPGQPKTFFYPDQRSPCLVVRLGEANPLGVGPDSDIVAYSQLCTHMGCPVSYSHAEKTFKCPCHFTVFDPERNGQMVSGQATVNLPRVLLRHDAADDSVYAVGVEGLIYGRQANMLETA
ncbi:arsenate reductase (azurin) small subunit [Ectothiorhodospiraceae bacterium WFHF3C12]|nr:arsenate reductase (azurin) small subunit [Ectothiorhodospiraceae bacterium WFHF3C12]